MSGRAGQAMAPARAVLLRLFAVPIGIAVLGMLGVVLLAWRLAQGPLPLPWVASRIEEMVSDAAGGLQLRLGGAALVWDGFRGGDDRPLEIDLTDIALSASDGTEVARLRSARLALSLGGLLHGRIQPRTVELGGLAVRAQRRPDGTLALMLEGDAAVSPPPVQGAQPSPTAADWVTDALGVLARAPVGDGVASQDWLSQLRLVRVRDATAVYLDSAGRPLLSVPHADLDLRRRPAGGLDAIATLDAKLGATTHRVAITAVLAPDGGRLRFDAAFPPILPASIPAALPMVPALAGLAALDLPVQLRATGSVDTAFRAPDMVVMAELGAGRVAVARGFVPIAGGRLRLEATPEQADVTVERLELAPPGNRPRSTFAGWMHARREDGRLYAAASITLDQLEFADLAALWPDGVGGKGLKPWLVQNITEGVAGGGQVELALTAPEDFSDVDLTHLAGSLEAKGLTLHWLRPVPPVEGADATLRFIGPDALEIAVRGGRQVRVGGANGLPLPPGAPPPSGGLAAQVQVKAGRILITGLAERDQLADIEVEMAGPVPEVLAVLRHPRLRLLDRKPIDIRDPAGQVTGRLNIDRLPLEDDVDVDQLRIRAETKLTGLRLGGVVAGRDLEAGTADLDATTEGLRARGTATLAGIPAQVTYEQDFRSGPPTQVVQKGTAIATGVTPAQLAAIGLETLDVVSGTSSLRAELLLRRNARGELAVKGDLLRNGLDLPWLAWSKPVGRPASVEARLNFERDRITLVDRLKLEGEGWQTQADLEFAAGRPRLLRLHRLQLGPRNNASGEVLWPTRPGGPWGVTLSGPTIDASAEFSRDKPSDPDEKGPPWIADLRFEQVAMAADTVLRNVAIRGESDGTYTRRLRMIGRTTGPLSGQFDMTIAPTPDGRGRTLAITAEDAGSLLRAIDVDRTVVGGRMNVTGRYDDVAAGRPLSGTAEITNFAIRDAPALAKLLQALSVYGVIDALRGGDMAFDELIAPFRLTGDIMEFADARTFNVSLGMTAKGRLDLLRKLIDVQGTIVPAYVFNSLLGRIPLLGRLVSPEEGGGLFAFNWSMRGPLADPDVGVNPLSAVTPGFLRGIFGIFRSDPIVPAPNAPVVTPSPTPPGSLRNGADGR